MGEWTDVCVRECVWCLSRGLAPEGGVRHPEKFSPVPQLRETPRTVFLRVRVRVRVGSALGVDCSATTSHRNRPSQPIGRQPAMPLSPPWRPRHSSVIETGSSLRFSSGDDGVVRRFGAKCYPLCLAPSLLEAPKPRQGKFMARPRGMGGVTLRDPCQSARGPCRSPSSSPANPAKRWQTAAKASSTTQHKTKLAPLTLDAKLRILDLRAGYEGSPEKKVDPDMRRLRIETAFWDAWHARGADFAAAADARYADAVRVCGDAVATMQKPASRHLTLPPLPPLETPSS